MRNFGARLLAIGLVCALAAGCSSSGPAAHGSSSSTTAASGPTTSTTVPAVTPKQAALALAHRMLALTVFPAGAQPSHAPLPKLLVGPPELPSGGNIVQAHSEWAVPGDAIAIAHFFAGHPPQGFVSGGTGSAGSDSGGARALNVIDTLGVLPANVADARLEIGVIGATTGTVLVRVDAVVQYTAVRPADERVPVSDHSVIVTVFRPYAPGKPVVRSVVVTEPARVVRIVAAFGRLRVAPTNVVFSCMMLTDKSVGYRVAFAPAPSGRPDVIATILACGPISVTVNGHSRPGLSLSGAFGQAVARALGQSELQFNGAG